MPDAALNGKCKFLGWLRSLMLAMLFLGAGLGPFVYQRHQCERQQNVVATIHALGGRIGLDSQRHIAYEWSRVVWGDRTPGSALWISLTRVTDEKLGHLPRLPELRSLFLNRTAITDAGLASIGRVGKLASLTCATPS